MKPINNDRKSSSPKQNNSVGGALLAFVLFLAGISLIYYLMFLYDDNDSEPSTKVNTPTETESIVETEETISIDVDVNQFAGISGAELISLLGTPRDVDSGVCAGELEIPCTYFDFLGTDDLGDVYFALVNDKVVRFTSFKERKYDNADNILARYGIEKGENIRRVSQGGPSERYRLPNDTIDDIWINEIDNDTFGSLQVTYEMMYYKKWYLPLSFSERSYYEDLTYAAVEQLLVAPKTADFQNPLDWTIVKNPFYIGVQGYVDAQNTYGVEIRNDFIVTWVAETNSVVHAVLNGKVIIDNGYIGIEDLVLEQVNTAN